MGEESKKPNLNRIKDLFRLVEKETYVRSKGLIDLKMCEGFAYDVLYINPTKYELNYTRSADGFSLLHIWLQCLYILEQILKLKQKNLELLLKN